MHLETSRDRELASRSQDSGGQVSQSSDSGCDASFLDTVQSFLLKMTSAETAVGCSNWVVKELPLGREKVAVAKFNMQLSVKWHQSAATEAERLERKEIHGKIFERYRRLATEQLLHALHLTHPDLLQLTHSPVKLIFHLYQHHSVLTQSMGSWVSCKPDIHKVADEIGDINQVNVNKIRLNLIEKWFRSTTQAKQDDLDVTLDATMCQTDDLEKYEDDSNLMRANYLLQYGPAETSTKFLLGLAFAVSTCMDVMCGLHYIVVLEQLQMSQTLKSFSKCNKLGLIKTILRSHSHKARAVRLAAELCLEYSIFEVQLWSNILKQLLAFHMLDFLQYVLIRLLPVSTLWQGSGIMAVWKGILMAPLLSVLFTLSVWKGILVAPLLSCQLSSHFQSGRASSWLHCCHVSSLHTFSLEGHPRGSTAVMSVLFTLSVWKGILVAPLLSCQFSSHFQSGRASSWLHCCHVSSLHTFSLEGHPRGSTAVMSVLFTLSVWKGILMTPLLSCQFSSHCQSGRASLWLHCCHVSSLHTFSLERHPHGSTAVTSVLFTLSVWKGILMAPLLSAVTPVSGGPLHDCLGSFVLLYRCPLLQDLDLATFSRRYLQLDLPVCAVACAMLIPPSDSRTACLRQVLTPATVTRLHQQLGEWTLQSSTDPVVQQLLLSLWHLEEDIEDLLSDKSQLVVDH
ncbi:Kinetochore-associated protein 1 [Lamellibrachia satsuma]|nr:Kinetochore-associated protein 1 [Lamellibrachia satsuma]